MSMKSHREWKEMWLFEATIAENSRDLPVIFSAAWLHPSVVELDG